MRYTRRHILLKIMAAVLALCVLACGCSSFRTNREGRTDASVAKQALRWSPAPLTAAQLETMIRSQGFYEREIHPQSEAKDADRRIEKDEDIVVVDRDHALMWASGIILRASAENALEVMTTMHYAGYNDWRLPTIEELASMLRPQPKAGKPYYPPALADFRQGTAISADQVADQPETRVWAVNFENGSVISVSADSFWFILPVRSTSVPSFESKTGASVRGLGKDW